MSERAKLRHTAEAQFHSAGDVHGVSVKPTVLLALMNELDEANRMLALCAADTTAADLAQEIEFLKAEWGSYECPDCHIRQFEPGRCSLCPGTDA